MKTLHKTLSFAQMMVRAQKRHDQRAAPPPAAVTASAPDRRMAPSKSVSLWMGAFAA